MVLTSCISTHWHYFYTCKKDFFYRIGPLTLHRYIDLCLLASVAFVNKQTCKNVLSLLFAIRIFLKMASLMKSGFRNFISRQLQKVLPLQVASCQVSSIVWTPPDIPEVFKNS